MADQNEIKQLLDDPNVTPETKKQLVRALAGSGGSEEDVRRYAEANGVEVPDDPGFWQHAGGVLLAPVTGGASVAYNVNEEMEHGAWTMEGGEADSLVNKAKEERELGSTQKVLNETGDVPTSDVLLDAGAPGLRFFEKFIPIYAEAAPVIGHNGQAPQLTEYIYRNYDEVSEIDFAKFREDAEKINKAAADLDNHENGLGTAWNALGAWEGDAANAANGYNGKFLNTAGTFIQNTKGAPGTITTAVGTMQQQVKEFAQHVHDMYSEQCGGLTVDQAKEAIRQAKGDVFENDGGILDWLAGVPGWLTGTVIGAICGGPLGILVGMGWSDWITDVRDRIIEDAKNKLRGLCQEFDGKKQAFDGYCQAVQTGVQGTYDTMFGQLDGQLTDKPFGQVGDPPSFTGEQGGRDKVDQPGGTSGTPGGTSGTPGGGGTPPGGGGTPPGGGGTPEVPKIENPLDKDGDGKPDVPGDTDGDGKPDDLDGDGKPDDPNAGKPDGLKGEEEPETVKIRSGENEITVTEPDENGHVKITVDTPTSEPKTYDVDFGKNPDALNALLGQNGAAPLTGTVPGGAAAGGTAPTPAGGPASAGDGSVPVQAGADGKALIELEGLSITAEVDPLTGEINLTVDDGDGTPEEYGVGFGADKADEKPGVPGDVTTLPAPDEGFRALPVDEGFHALPVDGPVDGGVGPSGATQEGSASGGFGSPDGVTQGSAVADGVVQGGPAPAEGATQGSAVSGGVGTPAQGSAVPPAWGVPVADVSAPVHGDQGAWTAPTGDRPAHGDHSFGGPAHAGVPGSGWAAPSFDGASNEGVTTASGASILGGNGGFDVADSVLGGSGTDTPWSGSAGDADLADTNASQAGEAGSATLPSMQDGPHQTTGTAGGGMMGGGMMGGGMAGGGQQQNGESERSPSQWRTSGSLFDDDMNLSRVQGVLGDEGGR
ncbi:hypothetical protein GCM10022243_05260 [Saccharothrix violaceirubra]|uniref:WXG100 family type VII secretion target n=1 Tax=Saccharothrix violaceirubra TaxID=413306 RepID=A0A7W7SYC3_9PSEU|nr:hypothetical protein [Saccharothrix violaceirubra]MBB4962936.1 hypothetical protein [Saccharothrix violaceirubra]